MGPNDCETGRKDRTEQIVFSYTEGGLQTFAAASRRSAIAQTTYANGLYHLLAFICQQAGELDVGSSLTELVTVGLSCWQRQLILQRNLGKLAAQLAQFRHQMAGRTIDEDGDRTLNTPARRWMSPSMKGLQPRPICRANPSAR